MVQIKEDMVARILVIGVGGAGINAINRMLEERMIGIEFVGIDTHTTGFDTHTRKLLLSHCKAKRCIHIGEKCTKGLGAMGDPEAGRAAAEENREEITRLVKGAEMVVVVCGMGGGNGTGASPVVAEISKKLGILTIGIITMPFSFEGFRMNKAISGMETLQKNVDTLIVISNEILLQSVDRQISLNAVLDKSNEVLQQSVQGITDLITKPLLVGLDFADVEMALKGKGIAHIGIGTGTGENKCMDAVKEAASSPLLETAIQGASSVIIHIFGDVDLLESSEATSYIENLTGEYTDIIYAPVYDDSSATTIIMITWHTIGLIGLVTYNF